MAKVDIPYMFPFLFFPDETQAATLAQNYLSGTRPQMGLTRVGFHGKPALCMAPMGPHAWWATYRKRPLPTPAAGSLADGQAGVLPSCARCPQGHLGDHVCDLRPVCDQLQTSTSTFLQEALSSTARCWASLQSKLSVPPFSIQLAVIIVQLTLQ